jgi:hypothetical protein
MFSEVKNIFTNKKLFNPILDIKEISS